MRSVIYVAILATCTGCASIVTGQNQPISVQTAAGYHPMAGAECALTNDKGEWFVVSPGSVMVTRSYEPLSVTCKKDGFAPGIASARSTTKGMAFGNILFGGLIGAAVDASSGAAYDYPPIITVRMTRIVVEPEVSTDSSGVAPAATVPPRAPSSPAAVSPPVDAPAAAIAPARPKATPSTPEGFPKGFVILGPH